MNMDVLTVSQLNFYVKSLVEADINLENVFLTGEISNFTDHYQSGHLYFSLKDDKSVVRAVMFAAFARRIRLRPHNGMKVIVRGRVGVYEASGVYQVYVEDMQPDGVGALSLAFEQLKIKLSKEGLFDECNKKTLPWCPQKVGVVTSETGAVFWDIQNVMNRRFPMAEIVFFPVLVQGEGAAEQIVQAIKRFNEEALCDVMIVARGGGSAEDLWTFNNERLVRSVASSKIPIISAVGHETDFTLCDFAADLRAPTPSAAAELVVPEASKLISDIEYWASYMNSLMLCRVSDCRKALNAFAKQGALSSPGRVFNDRKMVLDALFMAMELGFRETVSRYKEEFFLSASKLEALSPLKLLSSGYCVAVDAGNKAISHSNQVKKGDKISVILSDGKIECDVIGIYFGGK